MKKLTIVLAFISTQAIADDYDYMNATAYSHSYAQSSSTGGNSNASVTYPKHQEIKNVPGMGDIGLAPAATCHGTTSFGLSVVGTGFNFGSSWTDEECRMVQTAIQLIQIGMKEDGIAVLCQVEHTKVAPICKGNLK